MCRKNKGAVARRNAMINSFYTTSPTCPVTSQATSTTSLGTVCHSLRASHYAACSSGTSRHATYGPTSSPSRCSYSCWAPTPSPTCRASPTQCPPPRTTPSCWCTSPLHWPCWAALPCSIPSCVADPVPLPSCTPSTTSASCS